MASVIIGLLSGREALCTHGRQVRSYLHVADVGAAFAALLHGEVTGPVNIGSGEPISIAALLERLARQIGRTDLLRLGARAAPEGEPPLLVPDIGRLRDEVGFTPRWTLDEGLADAIGWWRGELARGARRPAAAHERLSGVASRWRCISRSRWWRRPRSLLSLARLKALERHATSLAIVGTWNLCLGALAALVALATGLAAVIHLQVGVPARLAISAACKVGHLQYHRTCCYWPHGAAQAAPRVRAPRGSFLVLLWAVTAALIVTGYRGGQNVYRYGIGVTHNEAGAEPHRQE